MPTTTPTKTKKKPKVKIDQKIKRKLASSHEVESQVIVHCHYRASLEEAEAIRIWKTTFLIPKGSNYKCKLIHHENITLCPRWTEVPAGAMHRFTLIFEGLPKDCLSFDLIEKIPQPGGFVCTDISRNNTDVYHVQFQ